MLRSVAIIAALIGVLVFPATAAAGRPGITTVNLRAWDGSAPVDGVRVCLDQGRTVTCGATEDGELWVDSLPAGPYRAWIEPGSEYELTGIGCATFPDLAYRPCVVRGTEVRFVIRKDVVAVNINFALDAR